MPEETRLIVDMDRVGFYINEIRNGEFNFPDLINGTFEEGVAVIEKGWVDNELNLSTASDPEGSGYINVVEPSYFCRIKGINDEGKEEWSDAAYLEDFGLSVDVDWHDPNWEKLLLKDMTEKLNIFVEKMGLSTDRPNWVGDSESKKFFDQFYGPATH